jgi:hypothetical protein
LFWFFSRKKILKKLNVVGSPVGPSILKNKEAKLRLMNCITVAGDSWEDQDPESHRVRKREQKRQESREIALDVFCSKGL